MKKLIAGMARYCTGRLAGGDSFRDMVRNESGAALVELGLGLTICIILMLGSAEMGRLAYAGIEIANAAHAGVQYGAQSHTSAADTAGIQTAATQDAPNVPGMTATATRFCKCIDGTTSTCAATDCAASRIVDYIQVTTTATVDPLIYVPGLPKSYTISGKAVSRLVQ